MEEKQYANAESTRAREFRDWVAPISGTLYRLRDVFLADMIRDGTFSLEDASALQAAKEKTEAGEPLDQFELALIDLFKRAMICRGIVDQNGLPWVFDKAASECGPGELSIHEFPRADYDFAFLAISERAGLTANLSAESVVSKEPVEGDRFRSEGDAGGAGSYEVSQPPEQATHGRDRAPVRRQAVRAGHAGGKRRAGVHRV